MTSGEPEKVRAIRTAVARELGLEPDEVDLIERSVPGSSEDEPFYVTLLILIPQKPELDDGKIEVALQAVQDLAWHDARYPWQLRWEYKA
jgi:hypothetical protein